MNLDHVGVATDDAAGLAALLGDLLDAPVVHEERYEDLQLVFLDPGGVPLELIEPVDPSGDGADARFLDRRGPGLHHLAYAVPDVAAALESARDRGLETIDDTPRPGSRGHEVAFLHPGSTGGVLVELVAHPGDG